MQKRRLGRSGIEVSPLGLGGWAAGGPFSGPDGHPSSYGHVDDAELTRAIHLAVDAGISFFDTSDNYGVGHGERLLGTALAGQRDKVSIATKFGYFGNEETRQVMGNDGSPEYVRRACENSLRRLQTDYIDLYQFHIFDYDLARAAEVRGVLEDLVAEGKIRGYGWSTNDLERARVFAEGEHCIAMQHAFNILMGKPEFLTLCAEYDLASINMIPLAQGILTGKFTPDTTIPEDDIRHGWNLKSGDKAEMLRKLAVIREVLTSDGRTLAQAALGWLWARSDRTIPIPGFKTVAQVQENIGAIEFGPLSASQMNEIDQILQQ